MLKTFKTCQRGNVAVLFSLAVLPLVGMIGLSVDYVRATNAKEVLQSSIDSTALSLSAAASMESQAQLETRAARFITDTARIRGDFTLAPVTVQRANGEITVSTSATIQTAFMQVLGQPAMTVSASATAVIGSRRIELALALDNTGSMGRLNKMAELKKASQVMFTELQKHIKQPGDIRVGIAPFDTRVKVDPNLRNAPWIKYQGSGFEWGEATNAAAWDGCLIDRDKPFDKTASMPNAADPATQYLAVKCSQGNLAQIKPLTTDFNALQTTIDAMQPAGCTNVTMGAVWGQNLLRNGNLLGSPSVTSPTTVKYLVLLTDGANTRSRFFKNQYGCPEDNAARAAMNPQTSAACQDAKDNGIQIFSIQVIDGDDNVLKGCASVITGKLRYYKITDASQLTAVFQEIAETVGSTRLTQ